MCSYVQLCALWCVVLVLQLKNFHTNGRPNGERHFKQDFHILMHSSNERIRDIEQGKCLRVCFGPGRSRNQYQTFEKQLLQINVKNEFTIKYVDCPKSSHFIGLLSFD